MAGVAGGVSAGQLSAGNAPTQFPALLPANIGLLQPGANYFRLADALLTLDPSSGFAAVQQAVTSLQALISGLQISINTLNGQVATLNGQITTLNSQIATINARLAAAGIP